jgi:hypothetical protein
MSAGEELWFTITQANGKKVTGVVHGAGGVLHANVDGQEARLHHLKRLRGLIRLATAGKELWAYEPQPGHVRVYPDYAAFDSGEAVDVDLRGARATLKPEGYVNKRGRPLRIRHHAQRLADRDWQQAPIYRRGDMPVREAFKPDRAVSEARRRMAGMSEHEKGLFEGEYLEHLERKKYGKLSGGKRRHSSIDRLEASINKLLK